MNSSLPLMLVAALAPIAPAAAAESGNPAAAEARALAYLAREVQRWQKDNACYSCHNNGDGARALYLARRLGQHVDRDAVAMTTLWLSRPHAWDDNGGDGEFSDRRLATFQFAAALAGAARAGAVRDPQPQREVAARIAALQEEDGSWRIDGPDALGAPTTWGRPLVTAMTRHTLVALDGENVREPVEQADRWLRALRPETVVDAAAVLIGLAAAEDEAAATQRRRCLDLIRAAQSKEGGWGPYASSAPEPFDTALVLIALANSPENDPARAMIQRGRRWLVAAQLADGSWPETTRPPGATSYSQRISTTAWCMEALLLTAP